MSEESKRPLEWLNEKRMVKELIPFDYNPRILTADRKQKLRKSLIKFNLAEVPAINTNNIIIAGHQRIKVLMELGRGEDFIDVRIPNRELTDIELKEYNIISNVPTGYWDVDVLTEFFDDIDLSELGLDLDGIELPDDLIPDEFENESEQPFTPEPPEEPISIVGDSYELISPQKKLTHKIICGDSTDELVYNWLFDQESIDLTVTDPPYNVDYKGGKNKPRQAIDNDNLKSDMFYNFLRDYYDQVYTNSKDGAPCYVFHADSEGINFRKAFIDTGFKLSQCLIWNKNTSVLSRNDYHWKHEPILYGWKLGAAHPWFSDRKQKTVLEFDKPLKSEEHPTMKPLDLISYLVTNSSRQKDIVFDGFLGSGTTLIASESCWRQFRGIELSPGYVDVSIKRWLKYMLDNKLDHTVTKNGNPLTQVQLLEYL